MKNIHVHRDTRSIYCHIQIAIEAPLATALTVANNVAVTYHCVDTWSLKSLTKLNSAVFIIYNHSVTTCDPQTMVKAATASTLTDNSHHYNAQAVTAKQLTYYIHIYTIVRNLPSGSHHKR